jgi:2-hydroxy-6-oxonona-2,4-dienedioate hydrolase
MASEDPRSVLDSFIARSREIRTPCGDGDMVWREWGNAAPGTVPVVLLHGGSGAWNHWVHNIPALEDRYRVIAADLPGCGDSADPSAPYDADSLAAIVSDGLDMVVPGGSPYDLVSFSFGGVISGLVAQRQGARLRSLTIVGTPVLGLIKGGKANDLRAVPADATSEEAAPIYRHNLEKLMVHDPAAIDDLAMCLHMENMANVRLRSRGIARRHPVMQDLVGATCGLNFIFGEHDPTLHPSLEGVRAYVAENHPGAGFEVVSGAGHWVPYEAPDAFNRLLLSWLQSLS